MQEPYNTTMRVSRLSNEDVAGALERVADLLEAQEGDAFRVRAWRRAAAVVGAHPEPVAEVFARSGHAGLDALPAIGANLSRAIGELLRTGRLALLDRLEGETTPERLLSTVPGIGPSLARRLHEELGVETLEALERAAHDGRLEAMRGMGPRRVRGLRDAVGAILGRAAQRRGRALRPSATRASAGSDVVPSVRTLLAVDEEYRLRGEAGELRRIAPRRFNPGGEAWLPILHARRGGFELTALYSNTARAHELGRTRDWVVLYFERDGEEGRCTVVTEGAGPLAGRRVVRGREEECARFYSRGSAAARVAATASENGASGGLTRRA